jgi:hypothetical protein
MAKAKPQKPAGQISSTLPEMKDWQAILGIILLVGIFFRDILLKNAFFWEDFMYYYYPARNFASVSMAGGELPLWNPFTFNGMPFQADIQTALFYIPNLMLTLFVSGGRLPFYWMEVEIIAHYMIAAVCMYYLAKSFGLKNTIAFFCGIMFALSGYMITRAIHQPMICETAWLPLIVLLFRRMLQTASVKYMLLGGIVLGHTILAGFPQLTLYIFFLLFLLFMFEFVFIHKEQGSKHSQRLIPLAVGVIVLSIALSAVQLLPTIELAPNSQRAEMSYQKSLDGSLSWPGLLTLVIPKLFGASGAQGSTFWGEGAYGQYWETCVYIGIAGLVMVVIASTQIRNNRHVAFLFGLAVFSLLYALGDSFVLHKLFFNYVPTFNKFREPGRLSFLWTFAAALLSGFGMQQLLEVNAQEKQRMYNIVFIIAGIGILLWVMISQGAFQSSRDKQLYEQIHAITVPEATTALIIILIVGAIIVLRLRNTLTMTVTLAALFAMQFIDMNIFGFNQNNGTTNLDDYFARPAEIVNKLKEEGKNEIFRINSRQGGAMILDRNQGMIDRIYSMEGYSSLVLQRIYPPGKDQRKIHDLMNARYFITIDEQQRSMGLGRSTTYVPRAYMVYDARKITDDAEQKSFMASDAFDPLRTVVIETDPVFPADTASKKNWKATITSYNLNSIAIDVSTPANGYLSLSEVYYPGWNAYVDGVPHPILRANWNLRAVPIEQGNHKVELRFEPKSFTQGMWITFTTLGITIAGLAFSFKKSPHAEINNEAA